MGNTVYFIPTIWIVSLVALDSIVVNCEENTCHSLLKRIKGCAKESIQVYSCDEDHKSNLLHCAENVAGFIDECNDTRIHRVIDNAIEMYKTSDKILCNDDNSYLEIGNGDGDGDDDCWNEASEVASKVADLTVPFLNEDGCRFNKFLSLSSNAATECNGKLKNYIEKIYDNSLCGGVRRNNPSQQVIEDCDHIIAAGDRCIQNVQKTPRCDIDKQPLLSCLDKLDQKKCTHLPIEKGLQTFRRLYKQNAHVFCRHPIIRQEIISNDCWHTIVILNLKWRAMFELFGSAEVCKMQNYLWEFYLSELDKSACASIAKEVEAESRLQLSCEEPNLANELKKNYFTISSVLILVKMLLYILSAR